MKRPYIYKKFINSSNTTWLFYVAVPLILLLSALPASSMSVVDSKHNLSVSGPGTIKAISEGEVCVFCHTPHKAQGVGLLWNKRDSTATYIPYSSTTIQTNIGQPTGASRLCLTCHDGTIALGDLGSRLLEIDMTQRYLDSGPAALTSDLSDDHPISFVYDSYLSIVNPEFKNPSLLIDEVKLDKNNELQCISCHDPHNNANGKFLRVVNSSSALCLKCHQKTGWSSCSHNLSTSTWNGIAPDPWKHTEWTTVAENACENCHRPHSAGSQERLLNEYAEENNCFPCHNGNVAALNIESQFSKLSFHPVASTAGIHEPKENFLTVQRHVECMDCHNPHQVNSSEASAPNVKGVQMGVTGVNAQGVPVKTASYQYEICFKCHGDSAEGTTAVPRQIRQLNRRLQFDLSNPAYHPVEGPGRNPNVPSLLPGYTTASVIYCTDCHSNNNGPGAGGSGPAGPHGSQNPYLLERQYIMNDYTSESPDNYALCYKCHDRNSILGNESFARHYFHIVRQNAPCAICHDPHGISSSQGNAVNNAHLINFDTSVVSPERMSGELKFEDLGTFKGRCYLRCHGRNHRGFSY